MVGCSAPAEQAGPLSLDFSEPVEFSPTDTAHVDDLLSQKLEIPPQLIPSGSSVTVSGFPVAELDLVSEYHETLHESVLLVNSDGALGTAWLVRPNLAFTAEHGTALLSNPNNIRMLTPDGEPVIGRVVAESKTYDLALIELEEEVGSKPLVLSEASALVGDPLFSIGHPGDYTAGYDTAWVTTVGLMSGFQERQTSFIRTTIPTIGGQSGSPIFDLSGQVVAVNGLCSYSAYGPGESLRAESSDQISYIPPRGECGGVDGAVLRWFLDQYDAGLQLETMPGWPDWRPEEYISLADEQMPHQFFDESSGTTVSGFPLEHLEHVASLHEEFRSSIVNMDIGDMYSKTGGTGWLVAPDVVLTNEHVLPRRGEDLPIRVETYDGIMIDATEIARDSQMDIALVRLDRPINAEPLRISTSPVTEDSAIFSIGHPSSLPRTWVTSVGVVASRKDPDVLFSTIPVSMGASGSPVFNLEGEVVGIIWGTQSVPIGENFVPAPSSLLLSYHPPIPHTAATPAREISDFLRMHLN